MVTSRGEEYISGKSSDVDDLQQIPTMCDDLSIKNA